MKFAFTTCVQLGLSCMEEVYRVGGALDLVITLPDTAANKKSGRIYADSFCARHGIRLLKTHNINDETVVNSIQENEIDWLLIIGWSQIAKAEILKAPRRGVLGMHPTLLPEGRGRASIPWAIIKGLPETGVTLFQLDEGVDTGPIIAQERLSLAKDETAQSLYHRVSAAHRTLIARLWLDLLNERIRPIPQDHSQATTWPARTPKDGEIFSTMTMDEVHRLVRATTHPYPGAFFRKDGGVIRIWHGRKANTISPPLPGTIRIALIDGAFDATDYQIEAIP